MAHHKMGLEPTALGLAAGRHHKGDGWSHIREEQEQGSEREREREREKERERERERGREGERAPVPCGTSCPIRTQTSSLLG